MVLIKFGLKNTGISYGKEVLKLYEVNGIKIAILSYTYGTNAFTNHVYINRKENTRVNLFQKQELSNILVRKLYQDSNIIIRIIRKILKILRLFQLNKMVYERTEYSKKQKKEIINKIQQYKQMGADCIIMCMHEGGQYNKEPIKRTKKTVEFLMKNGVDLIVGNHEHVAQYVKMQENKLITFSLGNFISTTGVTKEPFNKMAEYSILLNVYISKKDQKVNYDKYTFTIVKSVEDKVENGISVKVKLLYDLIEECNDEAEKQKLLADNQKIVQTIIGRTIDKTNIQKEYEIR